ncbi:MAG: hypothetical protein ACYDCN_13570, partial [Bacteroidia bacterium]
ASIYKSAAFLLFYYAFRQIFIPCFLNIHPNRKTYREFEGRLIKLPIATIKLPTTFFKRGGKC